MSEGIEIQLAPRIEKHCLNLWQDGHYKHAAREAIVQVEIALKDKGLVNDSRFGKTLIDSLFTSGGKHKTIKLRVPLGNELQEQAKQYFGAVFAYYRNYLAHDGSKVDKNSAVRVLVVASELLALIDASSLSYTDLGGIDGLLKAEVFDSEDQLLGVLDTCEDYALLGDDAEGLRESIFYNYGAGENHLDAVLELDLVRYIDTHFHDLDGFEEEGGWLELTDLGKKFIDEIKKKNNQKS
ncbi:MAG: TIGR02391 family protein [Aphanizomenon gracile PMC649.10]|nr:TIGR02391 family protein [Aphanizomenon gracile PMC649.10]